MVHSECQSPLPNTISRERQEKPIFDNLTIFDRLIGIHRAFLIEQAFAGLTQGMGLFLRSSGERILPTFFSGEGAMDRPKTDTPATMTVMVLLLFLIMAALTFMILYGENGLFHYREMVAERRKLVEVQNRQQEDNRKLYAEIQHLRGDRDYIEKVARTELGLVKDNELVYIFDASE